MPLERTEAWKILSQLRGYATGGELIQIFVYTLYQIMKDRNMIDHRLDFDDSYKELAERIEHSETLPFKHKLEALRRGLEEFSNDQLKDLAGYLFEYAIENDGRSMESSNKAICSLAIELLRIEAGDMVFDLGSGYGNFLADVVRNAQNRNIELKEVMGYEINPSAAAVSKMNLIISGAKYFNIHEGDFTNGVSAMYNKGFAFPPLGMRFRENEKKIKSQLFKEYAFKPNRNSYEWLFVDRLLSGLTGFNRRAVALLSPRCLFNEDDKEYRDLLLKAGWIESIIELPAGSLNFTGIKVCMVVFSENNNAVSVVDATEAIDRAKGKFASFKLPYERVLQMLETAPHKTIDELLEAHSLAPSSLLAGQGIKFEGKPLSEMAEVFTGCQYTSRNFEEMFTDDTTGYRILTSSDINDGIVDWYQLQSIDYKDNKFDKYAVQRNDVVVTAKSSKVKVVVVDIEPKEKILVTGGMLIVRPDTTKLNPTFLKIFLDSAKGQIALKMIQRGVNIITINSKDLATVIIPDETIELQNNISKKYNSKLSTYLALKDELKKLEEQLNNFDIEEMKEE